MVRIKAPPLQTGDRNAPKSRRPIKIRRSLDSLGRFLSVRLVLPRAVNNHHIARMAVILASGKNLRPGIQSSGRAQYTTKKPQSQKNAFLVGSAALKAVRLPETPAGTILPLSPMATNSSFSSQLSFPPNAAESVVPQETSFPLPTARLR